MRINSIARGLACGALVTAAVAQQHDVIVIGGGLSGLSAAQRLTKAGKDVVVLEARNRTGGRVHNAQLSNGGYTEVGAEFVGPTQDRVLAYIKDLGLKIYKTYNKGSNLLYHNGQGQKYDSNSPLLGAVPPVDPASLLQLEAILLQLDDMAKTVDPAQPWKSDNAAEWDSQTFATWVAPRALTPSAKFLIEESIEAIFSTEPEEPSLLYVVAYIAGAGNSTTPGTFERLISTPDGAQKYRVLGGTELIATRLAQRLGSRVILNSPVRKVTQSGKSCTVITDSGVSYSAKDVVVAMSPPIASRITYSPHLPASRDQLTQRMPMGAIGKAIAVYETPFWRDAGFTGQVVSDTGYARTTFDNSPKDASFGALMGFIEADDMRALDKVPVGRVQQLITKDYVRYFGPEARNIKEFVLQRWDNEMYSRGGPVAYAPPGVLTEYGPALRAKVGRIHFAGTESSDYWIGYMDGAIRSGERVASEILGT